MPEEMRMAPYRARKIEAGTENQWKGSCDVSEGFSKMKNELMNYLKTRGEERQTMVGEKNRKSWKRKPRRKGKSSRKVWNLVEMFYLQIGNKSDERK